MNTLTEILKLSIELENMKRENERDQKRVSARLAQIEALREKYVYARIVEIDPSSKATLFI